MELNETPTELNDPSPILGVTLKKPVHRKRMKIFFIAVHLDDEYLPCRLDSLFYEKNFEASHKIYRKSVNLIFTAAIVIMVIII